MNNTNNININDFDFDVDIAIQLMDECPYHNDHEHGRCNDCIEDEEILLLCDIAEECGGEG